MKVTVLGGCGHVGLPLGISLADSGLDVTLYDISARSVATVMGGTVPFHEPGATEVLRRVLAAGRLCATTDPSSVSMADVVVIVIGTPVDEHLNPDPTAIERALAVCRPWLRDGQTLVLRSTIYPGVTARLETLLAEFGRFHIAYCPERIAEGRAMTELRTLPQIIGCRNEAAYDAAAALFHVLTDRLIRTTPEEAELAKLFTNTWRYIKFAAANQFFMMADGFGVEFENVRQAMTLDYPRAADVPGAGFAAGPCLFKDTMQLSSFYDNHFVLGHSAMLVNEGLPLHLVSSFERRQPLQGLTAGILGMAFKAESDDIRSSLSYKLKRILGFRAKRVLCADPHVTVDPDLVGVDTVLRESDVIFVGAPHPEFSQLQIPERVQLVDVWNLFGRGVFA